MEDWKKQEIFSALVSEGAINADNFMRFARWFWCSLKDRLAYDEALHFFEALARSTLEDRAEMFIEAIRSNLENVECDNLEPLISVFDNLDLLRAAKLAAKIEEIAELPKKHIVIQDGNSFIICDPRGKVWIARHTRNGLVTRVVFHAYPDSVTIIRNPLGGTRSYEIRFRTTRYAFTAQGVFDEVLGVLRGEGLVALNQKASDVLSNIINYMYDNGLVWEKYEVDKPGFYLIDGELKAVKVPWAEAIIKRVTGKLMDFGVPTSELKEALIFLDELATKWYAHAKERFVTVIKWALVAPFNRIIKEFGDFVPWLYLWGVSRTGKSTMGRIVRALWNLGAEWEKVGANADNVPRLGYVVSMGTFPVIVNEAEVVLANDSLQAAVKTAVEGKIIRGRFFLGRGYIDIPALACLMMTSNKPFPADDALRRRFIVLHFSFSEKIEPEVEDEFRKNVEPRFPLLFTIGKAFLGYIVSVGYKIFAELPWHQVATNFLKFVYNQILGYVPDWVGLMYKPNIADVYEEEREVIKAIIIEALDRGYRGLIRDSAPLRERLRLAIANEVVSWVRFIPDNEQDNSAEDGRVLILRSISKELSKQGFDLSLKSLAELFGWDYRLVKIDGKPVRAIVVNLKDLLDELAPEGGVEVEGGGG